MDLPAKVDLKQDFRLLKWRSCFSRAFGSCAFRSMAIDESKFHTISIFSIENDFPESKGNSNPPVAFRCVIGLGLCFNVLLAYLQAEMMFLDSLILLKRSI